MSKLAQLRERRNAKSQEANALNNKYPADQRMPAAASEQLEAMLAEIEAVDTEIAREVRAMKLLEDDPTVAANALREKHTKEPGKHGDSETAPALRAYLRGGLNALSAADRAAMMARQTPDIQAAMSTTTPGEGGYTVAPEYHLRSDRQRHREGARPACEPVADDPGTGLEHGERHHARGAGGEPVSTYVEARDVATAVAAMAAGARPIAGGTDLVVGARHGKAPLPAGHRGDPSRSPS